MMLIRLVLIRLLFACSKRLAIREIKEIVSIVRLVYYTLGDNYMYKRVRDWRLYRRFGIWWTIAFGRTRVVDLLINEWLGMSKRLLGVVSAPVDNTLSTSGMTWEVSGNVLRLWILPHTCMGVVILIDCSINYSLIIIRLFEVWEKLAELIECI